VYGVEAWTFRKVDQKYLESCQIWCSRRMVKIGCTDRVENEEVDKVKEKGNMLYAIKRWKANWVGHILRGNCRLKTVMGVKTERRMEVMERQGIRRKWTLDGLKENRRYVLEIERENGILHNVQNSLW